MTKLNDKQKLFVKHYVKELNATNAAIAAGYSEKTARMQGCRLLTNDNISKAIANGLQKRMDKADIDAQYVLDELLACWRARIGDLFTKAGKLLPVYQWPDIWQKMIGSVTVKKITAGFSDADEDAIGEIVSMAQVDKAKYLKMLGDHTNIKAWDNTQKIEVNVVSERLSAAKKRMIGVPSEN